MGWVERFGELLILAPSPFSPQTNLQTPQTKTNPSPKNFNPFAFETISFCWAQNTSME